MFGKVTAEKMLGSLEGQLGEDDYTEPLNILINSANKNNLEDTINNSKSTLGYS